MILIIDNYDSFVYNLARYVIEAGYACEVVRNDKITIAEIEHLQPEKIILSPGPKSPDDAGISLNLINYFSGKIPILGVCLGHQAIGQAFGGRVVRAKLPLHGMSSSIIHNKRSLYFGLANPLTVGRYHSLVVSKQGFPNCLEIVSTSIEGEIMGIKHREYQVFGVQFHPESILTPSGFSLIQNFLNITNRTTL